MDELGPRGRDSDGAGFLAGGGEMGALMRAHDWSASTLGPVETWPAPLRTAVRIMLNTRHPIYIWWGGTGACLYNDAYRQSIGPERHPGSLGRPAREVWAEIWDIIGPQIEQVMAGRGATWHENALVPITRNGRRGLFRSSSSSMTRATLAKSPRTSSSNSAIASCRRGPPLRRF